MTVLRFLYLLGVALLLAVACFLILQVSSLFVERTEFNPFPSWPALLLQLAVTAVLSVGWYHWVVRKPWYKRHKVKLFLSYWLLCIVFAFVLITTNRYHDGWLQFPVIVLLTGMGLRNALWMIKYRQYRQFKKRRQQ